MTRPEWLPLAFSHIDFPPFNSRLDEVGIIAFAVSAFGFFVWLQDWDTDAGSKSETRARR
jgi:hypothetical protein